MRTQGHFLRTQSKHEDIVCAFIHLHLTGVFTVRLINISLFHCEAHPIAICIQTEKSSQWGDSYQAHSLSLPIPLNVLPGMVCMPILAGRDIINDWQRTLTLRTVARLAYGMMWLGGIESGRSPTNLDACGCLGRKTLRVVVV